MLPDTQPGNTKILYFFNCLLDGMHTRILIHLQSILEVTIEDTEKHTIFILTLIKKKKSTRVFMILVDFLLDEI